MRNIVPRASKEVKNYFRIAIVLVALAVYFGFAGRAHAVESIKTAQKNVNECYFVKSYSDSNKATSRIEAITENTAHWVTTSKSGYKYIALDMPDDYKWTTVVKNGVKKTTIDSKCRKYLFGVKKNGYILLTNSDGDRIIVGDKNKLKNYNTKKYVESHSTLNGEENSNRLYINSDSDIKTKIIGITVDGNKLNIKWRKTKLCDYYSVIATLNDKDEIGIPPYKNNTHNNHIEIVVPNGENEIDVSVRPIRYGCYNSVWGTSTQIKWRK